MADIRIRRDEAAYIGMGFHDLRLIKITLEVIGSNRAVLHSVVVPWSYIDIKFADKMCLISEKILIRNCGCYKPCTMGNPSCCEGLIA